MIVESPSESGAVHITRREVTVAESTVGCAIGAGFKKIAAGLRFVLGIQLFAVAQCCHAFNWLPTKFPVTIPE